MSLRATLGCTCTVVLLLGAAASCSSSIVYPGLLVGSFDTALVAKSNSCAFAALAGFCDDGSPGPCADGGYPDGGVTVLVVSSEVDGGGFISYQSGAQSATSSGSFNGQTVQTLGQANRYFIRSDQPPDDAGCGTVVTESIELSIYAALDGGCDGGIPLGPPPVELGGVWQTNASPACGLLVDVVTPDPRFCCAALLPDGSCGQPIPPPCTVSFNLSGQGRSSLP
jgi:hypothetical protein